MSVLSAGLLLWMETEAAQYFGRWQQWLFSAFRLLVGVLPAWGRRRKSRKAEEIIKLQMTRLSFVKLLETGPKFAPFACILVCLCLWSCGHWGIETGAASRIHPQAPKHHFSSSSPSQADSGAGGQQCVCVTQTPG